MKIILKLSCLIVLLFSSVVLVAENSNTTENEYRTLLNAATPHEAGPAALRTEAVKNGRIKVEVLSPALPNITFGNRIRYELTGLLNTAGENQLPRAQQGSLIMRKHGEQEAIGSFSVSVPKGQESAKFKLKGSLTYQLPLGIEAVDISSAQIGKAVKAVEGALQLTLMAIDRKSVKLEVVGPKDNVLKVEAFDAEGAPVKRLRGGVIKRGSKVEHVIRYANEPASLRVYVAKKLLNESYPFELESK